MHIKLTNGQPETYSIGQLRRDNPNTSFPKKIGDATLASYGVFPVEEIIKPEFDPLVQTLKRDAMPHKEVIRLKTEQDATDPFTGEVDQEQVGQPIYGNRWLIGYTVENKPLDRAEKAVRNHRDMLLSQTDWMALSDNTMTQAWREYRQQLRDVTAQENFPHAVIWPTKPE